jgi:hypothetical protein
MYYTELSLTFEVQGDACAKGVNSYEFYSTIIKDWTPTSTVYKYISGVWSCEISDTYKDRYQSLSPFDVYTNQVFSFIGNQTEPRFVIQDNSNISGDIAFNKYKTIFKADKNAKMHIQKQQDKKID